MGLDAIAQRRRAKWRQKVADHKNRQIGRSVIGAVVAQVFFADRTMVAHFQIALKHRACPTIWAFPAPTPMQGLFHWAVVFGQNGVRHIGFTHNVSLAARCAKMCWFARTIKGAIQLASRCRKAPDWQLRQKRLKKCDGKLAGPRFTITEQAMSRHRNT